MAEKAKEPSGERQPEAGGSGTKASVLKVKTSKGKEVVVEQVKGEKQPEDTAKKIPEEKVKDESEPGEDESLDSNKFEEVYEPPVEFKDPLYELMEGQEMEEEYAQMTLEEEETIIAQLTPQERAEHQEISEFYQIQAATSGQGWFQDWK